MWMYLCSSWRWAGPGCPPPHCRRKRCRGTRPATALSSWDQFNPCSLPISFGGGWLWITHWHAKPVLGIHDISVRIRGCIPLTNGSWYFRQWPSIWQPIFIVFTEFFFVYYLLFEATFTSFSKIKSHKEVSGSVNRTNGSGRPKNIRILRIRIPNTACNKLFLWLLTICSRKLVTVHTVAKLPN
jgi:hypothetical protein